MIYHSYTHTYMHKQTGARRCRQVRLWRMSYQTGQIYMSSQEALLVEGIAASQPSSHQPQAHNSKEEEMLDKGSFVARTMAATNSSPRRVILTPRASFTLPRLSSMIPRKGGPVARKGSMTGMNFTRYVHGEPHFRRILHTCIHKHID